MMHNLSLLRVAGDLAAYATARHSVIARNIANADTPSFRSRDLAPFSAHKKESFSGHMRATRTQHISVEDRGPSVGHAQESTQNIAPNGNSVSLETEMMRMAENRHDYDRALAVYRSTINVLRASIGRG